MAPFEPDGVYAGIPYRVLPDNSIEAMLPGGLVKFKDMNHLLASATGAQATPAAKLAGSSLIETAASVPASTRPADYYSVLLDTINRTKHNSAQLRALVYERARFNLKRDILFGHPSLGLADLVERANEFELAVARIEASVADEQPVPVHREPPQPPSVVAEITPSKAIQILPPLRPLASREAGLALLQAVESFWQERRPQTFWPPPYVRSSQLVRFLLVGLIILGVAGTGAALWRSSKVPTQVETASKAPQPGDTAAKHDGEQQTAAAEAKPPAAALALPTSFGIYLLSDNKLVELQALPINVPDRRVAISAPIHKPSTTVVVDDRPAFILFRRDLQNNAPQTISLRTIARVTRSMKIVNGKATNEAIEGTWRVRNISRTLKVSPVPGQREMVMARVDDDALPAGRYALVLGQTGYDFTVAGPIKSRDFCLEEFEAAGGSMLNECRKL